MLPLSEQEVGLFPSLNMRTEWLADASLEDTERESPIKGKILQ